MDSPPPARGPAGRLRAMFFRHFPPGTTPDWPAVVAWVNEKVPAAEQAAVRAWVARRIDAPPRSAAARRREEYPLLVRLDEFELYREIDSGGMGVVYEAYDTLLDRTVAVKRPRPGLEHGQATRFEGEVRITAGHPHPGITPVYRLGRDAGGVPYMAMLYVDGRTLADRLKSAEAPADEWFEVTLDTFVKVCQAVGSRHAYQIVHRDLKPSNVKIGRDGEVYVLDWGLSRVWAGEDAAAPPARASSFGTLAYMAPEQFCGTHTPRTDVFQLGGMLCELLTGQPPYPVPERDPGKRQILLETTRARLAGVPDPGRRELAQLARVCLSPDPEARPDHGADLADTLNRIRAATAKAGREAETRTRVAAVNRRKRQWTTVTVVVALAFGWYWWETARQQTAERGENRRMAEVALERAEAGVRAGRPPYDAIDTALDQLGQRLSKEGCDDLRPRAESCRADLALLKELDAVDDRLFTTTDGGWRFIPRDRVAGDYAAAFRRYGVDPAAGGGEAVDRLNRSLVRERALASLDLWLVAGRAEDVLRLLEAADNDAFRTTVRRAVQAGAQAALRRLPEDPQAAAQPVWFAVVFGQLSAVPADLRRQQLLAAARLAPDNFPVLMTLGKLRPVGQAAGAAERVRWYQAAVAARPGHEEALLALGAALADDGQHAAAAACYEEVLAANPRHAFARNNLGNALLYLNRPDDALAHYTEAVRLDPKYPFPLHGAGGAWMMKGDRLQAALYCEAAVALDRGYAHPHWRLGKLHALRQEWERAEARYREAIRLSPGFASAHKDLADALLSRPTRRPADLGEAIGCYRKAIALNPKWAEPYHALGEALRQQKDLSGAEEAFRRAIALDPAYASPHNGLANLLADRGQWAEAARYYGTAAELDPTFVFAHNGLGNALLELGNTAVAECSFRRAIRLDPGYAVAHNGLGNVLMRKPNRAERDVAEAIESYERAIDLDPMLPQPRNGLGHAFRAKGEGRRAAACYGAALCVDPGYRLAHLGLGNTLVDLGDLDAAHAEFHKFLAQGRQRHLAHTGLGTIAERRRAWGEAELHYRLALETEPGYSPARQGLGRAITGRANAGGGARP